uniref:DNA polymerase delta catalytic subunit n=1 Tax=Psilocybe cubensis TaxID=181762 RepID=A0A8H7XT18_PSICU
MATGLAPAASVSDVLKELSVKENDVQKPWERPPLSASYAAKPCIKFQKIDIAESSYDLGSPEIHLFGITKNGHSILVRVVGYEHYAYYLVPKGFSKDDLEPLRNNLNELIVESYEEVSSAPISRIDLEKGKGELSYLKIMVSDYHDLDEHSKAQIFQLGRCKYRDMFPNPQNPCWTRRYVNAMSWLKLTAKKYKIVPAENKISTCQLEVSIHDEHIMLTSGQAEMGPLRILSFDIETDIPDDRNVFPTARNYPIFTIGNRISTYGRANSDDVQIVFTLGSCSPISGATVVACEDEAALLLAWKSFIIEVDPDIVLGHNITRFDMPFLLGRAIVHNLDEFPYLGRLKCK